MLTNLLTYRWVILNALLGLGVVVAYERGLLRLVWEADVSRITTLIVFLFVVYLWGQGVKVFKISSDLNELKKSSGFPPGVNPGSLETLLLEREKAMTKVRWMQQANVVLVTLGLIGTVLGFIMALSGVDASSVGDVSGVENTISRLIDGMSVALYTTLVGSVLGLWIQVNARMITTAIYNYHCDLMLRYEEAAAEL